MPVQKQQLPKQPRDSPANAKQRAAQPIAKPLMAVDVKQPGDCVASLRIFVCADPQADPARQEIATRLAGDLELPLLDKRQQQDVDALLVVTANRLELRMIGGDPLTRGGKPLVVDLTRIDVSSTMGSRIRQPIGKAIGLKKLADPRPTVIDCTAGWGEDSWLMAGLGCRVFAIERNLLMAELLRDGLLHANTKHPDVAARITLIQVNAIDLLQQLADSDRTGQSIASPLPWLPAVPMDAIQPDVVFLDPMFPVRRKGAEGKPMKVLRQLVGDDSDAPALLAAAKAVALRRVVVKRPLHGEPIGGDAPAVSHKGKSVRYDVYPTL